MTDRVYFLTFSFQFYSHKLNTIKSNSPFERVVGDLFFLLYTFLSCNPIELFLLNSIMYNILISCSVPYQMHSLRLFFEENILTRVDRRFCSLFLSSSSLSHHLSPFSLSLSHRVSLSFFPCFFILIFYPQTPARRNMVFSHNKPINFHPASDTKKGRNFIIILSTSYDDFTSVTIQPVE